VTQIWVVGVTAKAAKAETWLNVPVALPNGSEISMDGKTGGQQRLAGVQHW
jgi:hypothetical protein